MVVLETETLEEAKKLKEKTTLRAFGWRSYVVSSYSVDLGVRETMVE